MVNAANLALTTIERPNPYLDGPAHARDGWRRGHASHPRAAIRQEVKIIAVTASVFKEEQLELFGAGMNDFIRPSRARPYAIGGKFPIPVNPAGVGG
jgi:hypothetical protein